MRERTTADMKNAILRLSAMLLAVCLIAGIPLASAADGFNYAYTYTYDYWGDLRNSPDAYRAKALITSADLGLEKPLVNPQGLFVQGDDMYIVDTGNNRILQLHHDNGLYTVTRIIDSFQGDIEPLTFSAPQDVYVTEEGTLFIADTSNNRILKLDKDLNLLETFLNSHSGFDRDDLPGWLDLFHVMMNEPADKMEKAAKVLDRAMRVPNTLSFREFYNIKSSSED